MVDVLFKNIVRTYVINLPSSIKRKKHIVKEFKRVGIVNYEFFQAVEKNSPEVEKLIQTGFIKAFPPCFRCGNNTCTCLNNVLIRNQVANWCSFIHVFKKIIQDRDGLYLICEDDIVFIDNHRIVIETLINADMFRKCGTDLNQPLLVRLEERGKSQNTGRPSFTNVITMSNACFLINRHFARAFLDHLQSIDTTSDIYIHKDLIKRCNNIQHLTADPSPAYQLSISANAKFYSEIHPKGIDWFDRWRKLKHIKRVDFSLPKVKYLWHSPCAGNLNVGDQVTPYLFKKMTGVEMVNVHPSETDEPVVLATGSIIQEKHVKFGNSIVWGSGVMFEDIPEFSCLKVLAVRGPLTRKIMINYGIDCPEIYGDPALLLPRYYYPFFLRNGFKNNRIGFIFHHSHIDLLDSVTIPEDCILIDITSDIESFIDQILDCDYTVSTALHGVIISHAYGVKSMPLFREDRPLSGGYFKFNDYYSSLGICDYPKKSVKEFLDFGTGEIVKIIENFPNPKFPIDTTNLYNSCPFLNLAYSIIDKSDSNHPWNYIHRYLRKTAFRNIHQIFFQYLKRIYNFIGLITGMTIVSMLW